LVTDGVGYVSTRAKYFYVDNPDAFTIYHYVPIYYVRNVQELSSNLFTSLNMKLNFIYSVRTAQ